MADAILSERISRAPQIRAALFKRRNMVDVTGIEPVTPCLQSRREKTLKALSGDVAYTETDKIFALSNVPKLYRISQIKESLCCLDIFAQLFSPRTAVSGPETRVDGELRQVCQACGGFIRPIGPTARQDLNNAERR